VSSCSSRRKVTAMADLAYLALTVVFFAAVALLARRTDRS
jgi:hypothetical protein